MGRGFASVILAAALAWSATSVMLFASAIPPSGPMTIWEGYARGWVTVTQVDITYDRDGVIVELPVGYRVSVAASAPVSVEVDEPAMLMSPSPAQFGVDPADPTTQDGALTTATIPPGGSLTYSYADEWLQGFLPPPPWWCTEPSQQTEPDVGIVLGGEILPAALQEIIANPYHDSDTRNTQQDLWNYLRDHATIVVGKTPLWKEIPGTAGQILSITVAATNIAVKDDNDAFTGDVDAHGSVVADRVPAGWTVVAGSFSVAPTSVTDNPDGSKTVTWTIDLPAADITGKDLSGPTPYPGIKLRYQVETPRLPAGRVELARAEVDTDADEIVDAHSAIPIVDVFSVNTAPTAVLGGPYMGVEGSPIRFDAGASTDPDGDALQFRWDFESDGTWDTAFTSSPASPPRTFGDDRAGTVSVEVSDGELSALATAAYTINNVPANMDTLVIGTTDEGSPAAITVTFSDPGWLDTHTAFVDWGGGVMETIALSSTHDPPAATGTFTLSRAFGDDFSYTPRVAIIDDDGGSVIQDPSVRVTNVAPTVLPFDFQVFVESQVCLRVAGDSYHTVRLDLFADSTLAGSVSVTRTPGNPNKQTGCVEVEVDLLASHAFHAEVTFEPEPGARRGSDSVWLLVRPMRAPNTPGHAALTMHHVFHVGDPSTYTWNVTLPDLAATLIEGCGCDGKDDDHDGREDDDDEDDGDDRDDDGEDGPASLLGGGASDDDEDDDDSDDDEDDDEDEDACGVSVGFRATAADPGSDDLTFTWDFGDGTNTSRTYFNDAVGPDPAPSPGGVFPVSVTNETTHVYRTGGNFVVTLTVTDDDGGTVTVLADVLRCTQDDDDDEDDDCDDDRDGGEHPGDDDEGDDDCDDDGGDGRGDDGRGGRDDDDGDD
jgi:hypothetical protein